MAISRPARRPERTQLGRRATWLSVTARSPPRPTRAHFRGRPDKKSLTPTGWTRAGRLVELRRRAAQRNKHDPVQPAWPRWTEQTITTTLSEFLADRDERPKARRVRRCGTEGPVPRGPQTWRVASVGGANERPLDRPHGRAAQPQLDRGAGPSRTVCVLERPQRLANRTGLRRRRAKRPTESGTASRRY